MAHRPGKQKFAIPAWEFWTIQLSNLPVLGFWVVNSIRTFDPSFFSAVNPALYTGGFYGNAKWEIYQLIPKDHLPRTRLIGADVKTPEHLQQLISEMNMSYPVILKPDIGERGLNVFKVEDQEGAGKALRSIHGAAILQEFVDYPIEVSVLAYTIPGYNEEGITSVCLKEFLSITGNGCSTIRELMLADNRSARHVERISRKIALDVVPEAGEEILLEPIGNHSCGTKFLDGSHLIDAQLHDVILGILKRMPGVAYGRFDIKTQSIDDLKQGRNFRILEFNGVNSEPVHIYDPSKSITEIYATLWYHWNLLVRISRAQKRQGVKSMGVPAGLKALWDYRNYIKKASRKAI